MLKAFKENVVRSSAHHEKVHCSVNLVSANSNVVVEETLHTNNPIHSHSVVESLPFVAEVPNSTTMGNTSSSSGISCTSGVESLKSGKMTTGTSQEELERYAMTQEFLLQANSPDEASQVSKLSHSDSLEQLDASPPSSKVPSRSSSNASSEKHRRSFRRFRNHGPKMLERIANAFQAAGNAVGSKLNGMEHLMFPHSPQVGSASIGHGAPAFSVTPKVRGGVLLRGCMDDEEHKQIVRQSIAIMKELKGADGLKAVGLEFRTVPNDVLDSPGDDTTKEDDDEITTSTTESSESDPLQNMTRLFHAESNTMIAVENRKEFIADGDMYDQVARLCQEYAQEVMIQDGDLEWVTVCDAGNNSEPIRALVSAALSKDEENLDKTPTLLIATGKGKVRAGVFSRQHLIVSGMECSTAIPIVREANKRKMNVIMLDPNVHGDRLGMVTFEKSMSRLFRRWESEEIIVSSDRPPLAKRDLYVLSHSQSGAQFARYLLEKSNHYVPHIRAVAFTDSTHNIQWARENKDLHQLLQSDNCVYFKCANESPKEVLDPLETTGEIVETDHFWEHRFGQIQTRCAGTAEHSLTNWFARYHIWDHFDQFLHSHHSKKEQVPAESS